ncbi:TetR/AcrR family transcriptional regulator [Nocardia bovistercoris]|uniref:TetR family transcriptional regulator n=1 Tax=Nocardia bovistercoris TaxID=2785916 RepID=A0A931IGJ2_9NOCA|nr:TetR family transcriptional regulator [Nocardia bovistercoris]MBH0779268.1 TetR family transcriptional regulator [Nocardia bovistercoris]
MVDSPADSAPRGLRERAKTKRRIAIQRAALELFVERGFEATTISNVAERAEVARRTVMMYFPAKIDLALSWFDEMGVRLQAAFAASPSNPDFVSVLEQWLGAEAATQDPQLAALAWDLLESDPRLRALSRSRMVARLTTQTADAFALRTGLEPDRPMFAIAGQAVAAATDEYLATTARHGYRPELHRDFLRFLRRITDADSPADSAPTPVHSRVFDSDQASSPPPS